MKSKANTRVVVIDSRPDLAVRFEQHSAGRLLVTHQPLNSSLRNLLGRPPHAVVIGPSVTKDRTIDLCRLIRGTPALSITSLLVVRNDSRDGAAFETDAFAAGADEVVFHPSSLFMRFDALMLRKQGSAASDDRVMSADERPSITVGKLTIYELDYAVIADGQRVALTAGEFRILWKLAVERGRTVTAEQLAPVDLINELYSSLSSVRSLVFSLRGKLGQYAHQLQTVRRAGYRLAE